MTAFVVGVVHFFMKFLNGIIPEFDSISEVFSNAQTWSGAVVDFVKNVNFIIPLPTIVTIVGIEIGIQVVLVAFWVGNKITKVVTSLIP